jgi:hypothetical protein
MSRSLLLSLVLLPAALLPASVFAGRLDIAIIQFTDARSQENIAAGLAKVDLFKITDSDSTETGDPALRGGHVIFVQSLPAAPGASFTTSTRLTNQRADVAGSLDGSHLNVEITIMEGVKVGLRKFQQSNYSASGSVAGGVPVIVGIKQSSGKTQSTIKGKAKVISYDFTSVIVAHYTP